MALPLEGIRVLDFGWVNAGAKAARYLSAYGADVIHLEWKGRLDILRTSSPPHRMPPGSSPGPSVNRGSSFNTNHAGKWGISLNMRHPRGKDLLERLLGVSDIVVENFAATAMESWGFGWDRLRAIKPDIIYVQAPGFGRKGPYGEYRTYGPTAAAISGLTSQVGLPDRYPCGFGVSYMDAMGPFFIAMAAMGALRRRAQTGKGVYVDLSQAGPALLLTGTAIPEFSVSGRPYERTGNRSPYSMAAPHGVYRCRGPSTGSGQAPAGEWIAIACSTEEHWRGLVKVMGAPAWTAEPRFATLEDRCQNQDEVDSLVEGWTRDQDRYDLMDRLQGAGVPAGACQDTRDRAERDLALRHRGYFVPVRHSEVPEFRVEGHASIFSDAPVSPLGRTGWGAPCYAEHNPQIYGDLLGLSPADVAALAKEEVI